MGNLLFVGSSGGHLAQMLNMKSWWSGHERSWVTFDTPDAVSALVGEQVTWAFHPTTRSPWNELRNFWLSIGTLRRVRPDVVVSAGAGVALPFFITARLLRVPTASVEVYDRIDSRTLTGVIERVI